jgi:branched-chain amino acid transport system ATP-binding protein
VLEIRDLDAAYGDIRVLTGVTLSVGPGEIVALLGPNGAGKSTLLNSIAGLLRPRAGAIRFEGEDLNGVHAHLIVERGVALVPEGRRLFGGMTVEENLELGAFANRARATKAAGLERVFALFPDLRERRRQLVRALSGGQQQMVAVGRALMTNPRLLMLDEPSLGIAPRLVRSIMESLIEINRDGVAVFLVEQNVQAALGLAHRGYVLESGRVALQGSAAELLGDPHVRRAYLGVLAQQLVLGLLIGGLYGLAAAGLSLVFGVLKVLDVAHGELIMLGGYMAFFVVTLVGLDPFVALLLVIPLSLLLGLALYWGLFGFVVRADEETRVKNSLLIGFGLALALHALAVRLWTADERSIVTSWGGAVISVGDLSIPVVRLVSLTVAFALIGGLHLLLARWRWGKAIRATAEDWQAALLTGIDVRRAYLLAFAIGTALAGAAGTLVTVGYSVSPSIGLEWTLKALIVVVLAGLGSMIGTFVGGLLLGVAEAASAAAFGGPYREVVGLVIFVVVLVVRPRGLFGR